MGSILPFLAVDVINFYWYKSNFNLLYLLCSFYDNFHLAIHKISTTQKSWVVDKETATTTTVLPGKTI